jgi:hypothetical protein
MSWYIAAHNSLSIYYTSFHNDMNGKHLYQLGAVAKFLSFLCIL